MVNARTRKAFGSAQWNVDIGPLSLSEIHDLYKNIISQIKKDHKYGGYDAVLYMMGSKTANLLAKSVFVSRWPTSDITEDVQSLGSGNSLVKSVTKHVEREWDNENIYISADIASKEVQTHKQKVSHLY